MVSFSSGFSILFLKKKKKTIGIVIWVMTWWWVDFSVIHLPSRLKSPPHLVDFPPCYYPSGNRIPDKGNDWLLLGWEPSYLEAGPVSKRFTTQSRSWSMLWPHVCDTGTGTRRSRGSTVHTDSLSWRKMIGTGVCLNCWLLVHIVMCELWVTGSFSNFKMPSWSIKILALWQLTNLHQ